MSGDDRSVRARDIIGSAVNTGDRSTVRTRTGPISLPAMDQVDVKVELAALRQALAALQNVPDRRALNNALEDAAEEVGKPEPDKDKIGGALERVTGYAKAADDFADHAEKLGPPLMALAAWLGPFGHHLLTLLGLSS